MKKSKWILALLTFLLLSVQVQGEDWRDQMAQMLEIDASIEWMEDSASVVKSLIWTGQGIDKINYTFMKEMDLTGTAEPGTFIYYGIMLQERGGLSLWEKRTVEVGAAGLVQEKIALPLIGQHYIVVVVEEQGRFYGSVYTVNRRSERLEEDLKQFRLNMYEVCSP